MQGYEVSQCAFYCLKDSGNIEDSQSILYSVLDYLKTRPRHGRAQCVYHYLDAHIYTILGNEEETIQRLKEALDSGLKTNWWEIKNHSFYSKKDLKRM